LASSTGRILPPRNVERRAASRPPDYDYVLFIGEQLRYLPDRLAEVGDIAILVQFDRVRAHVEAAFAADRGRGEAARQHRPAGRNRVIF
jgi:hypothetical protein